MEWRDVQSRINDVLKEIDDLKADGDDTAEILACSFRMLAE